MIAIVSDLSEARDSAATGLFGETFLLRRGYINIEFNYSLTHISWTTSMLNFCKEAIFPDFVVLSWRIPLQIFNESNH